MLRPLCLMPVRQGGWQPLPEDSGVWRARMTMRDNLGTGCQQMVFSNSRVFAQLPWSLSLTLKPLARGPGTPQGPSISVHLSLSAIQCPPLSPQAHQPLLLSHQPGRSPSGFIYGHTLCSRLSTGILEPAPNPRGSAQSFVSLLFNL